MQEKENPGWEPLQGEKRSAAENGGSWPLPFLCFKLSWAAPCHQLGWKAPVIPLDNQHVFYASMPPFNAGGFGKDVALLKKPKIAKSECATAMTLALQAIKAGKPLKSSFNKALKA